LRVDRVDRVAAVRASVMAALGLHRLRLKDTLDLRGSILLEPLAAAVVVLAKLAESVRGPMAETGLPRPSLDHL
jgi:hypothetical protein